MQGRGAGGCVSLRPTPGKALFFRRGAKTFCREEPPAAMGVCASFPGKPYSSVEGRKLFAGKRRRRRCGFAPHSQESLILPLRGANLLPGKAPGVCVSLRLTPRESLIPPLRGENQLPGEAPAAVGVCASFQGKPYFSVEGRKPIAGKRRRRLCAFAPHTRESLILPSRGATFCPEKPPAAEGVCAPYPGKPYPSVEGRKLFAGKSPRRR